jgi:hypothetical protein
MAASHVFLGFICAFVIGGSGLPGGSGVATSSLRGRMTKQSHEVAALRRAPRNDGDRVLSIARAEVGVREVGQNGGKRISEYSAYTGIKVPAPYCASFVSWCFGQAGYKEPRTAWSPALFPAERQVEIATARAELVSVSRTAPRNDVNSTSSLRGRMTKQSQVRGLVFGIYFPELKRIGHCGFVEEVRGEWVQTIEGNTSPNGGREGIGVFRRLRHKKTICKYSNWL